MFSLRQLSRGIRMGLVLAAVGLPFLVADRFWLNLLTLGWINLIAVLGLVLLFGYANQISFGHAAFIGVGAYLSGLMTKDLGLSIAATVPLAMIAGWVLGFIVGRPLLRLQGLALAMGTLAFGLLAFVIFREVPATGGAQGLPGIPPLAIGGLDLSSPEGSYWATLVVALVAARVCQNIVGSRVGRSLQAIGASPTAAGVTGIDAASYKTAIFAVSASLAALSGALYAHYVTFVSSGTFDLELSITLVVMVVVGGARSLWGAAVATLFLTILPGYLGGFGAYSSLIYGLILVAAFMYLPSGLAGLVETLRGVVQGWTSPRRARGTATAPTR